MKDDFGYFGSWLEGYVQYNEAFKQNCDTISTPNDIPSDEVLGFEPEEDCSADDDLDMSLEDEDSIGNGKI